MICSVRSLGVHGIRGYGVTVECFVTTGLSNFDIVGLGDTAVKEAGYRVRAAIKAVGVSFPQGRVIINLASKEYSKCIEKYLEPEDWFITCVFGEPAKGKLVQKGVYAKMARGEMVRFLAGIQAEKPEQMKDFCWSGYHFAEERSSDTEYVFLRTKVPGKDLPGEKSDW